LLSLESVKDYDKNKSSVLSTLPKKGRFHRTQRRWERQTAGGGIRPPRTGLGGFAKMQPGATRERGAGGQNKKVHVGQVTTGAA